MSRPKVKRLDLDMAELEAILERTRSGPLCEEEHHRLKAVVTTLAHLTQELEKKRTSIARLRNLRPPDLRDYVLTPIFGKAPSNTMNSQRPRINHSHAIS